MKKSSFQQVIFAKSTHSLTKLRMSKGPAGLGVYMCVLEALFDESSAMLPKEYDVIAYRFGIDEEDVRSVVEDFELFDFTDDGMFYCELLLARRNRPKRRRAADVQAEVQPEVDAAPCNEQVAEPARITVEGQADALRNDSEWIKRTAATFDIDELELGDYLAQYEGACAENHIIHCDMEDHKNSFILWLSSLFNQSS